MPDPVVRDFAPADAPRAAALLRRIRQSFVTANRLIHYMEAVPPEGQPRAWVVLVDEDIVGFGRAEFAWWYERKGVGRIVLAVDERHRRRGIGGQLHDLAEAHLREHGAETATGSASLEESDLGFAKRRGYRHVRTERYWTLEPSGADLSSLPELEEKLAAQGFRLADLSTVRDRERELYELYMATTRDSPSDEPVGKVDIDVWRRDAWGDPYLSFEGSFVVLADERPVSLAWLVADHEGSVAEHEFTGTLREFRHRGLARLAKLATIRWAAQNGIRTLQTSNDSTNADMLALNEHLGYQPTVERAEMRKEL